MKYCFNNQLIVPLMLKAMITIRILDADLR